MWGLISFAKGRVRRLCLQALAEGPLAPTDIARSQGLHLSHVSRALRELTAKGLAECLTPEASKNRIYGITGKGRKVLEALRGMGGAGREGDG